MGCATGCKPDVLNYHQTYSPLPEGLGVCKKEHAVNSNNRQLTTEIGLGVCEKEHAVDSNNQQL
ncbi:hypothetical protein B6A10_15360 [Flavobacterium sp. L1I52]|uniref:Uncharacterized protein n=1 Tax=Flavobacterium pokkalii TaxID=1940408 RepID=A0ABR7UUQ4_9FLAO|nr:hypothetical protein [Flavobacterium pokkalii]